MNFLGKIWTPCFQEREDKFLLAEKTDNSDPCRFRLEITMKDINGVTRLANAIFSFGISANKPDKYPMNIKVGGMGDQAKLRGKGVSKDTSGYKIYSVRSTDQHIKYFFVTKLISRR